MTFSLTLSLTYFSDILSAVFSDIFSNILADIRSDISSLNFFENLWDDGGWGSAASIGRKWSRLRSGSEPWTRMIAVEAWQRTQGADARGWDLGSEHWTQMLARARTRRRGGDERTQNLTTLTSDRCGKSKNSLNLCQPLFAKQKSPLSKAKQPQKWTEAKRSKQTQQIMVLQPQHGCGLRHVSPKPKVCSSNGRPDRASKTILSRVAWVGTWKGVIPFKLHPCSLSLSLHLLKVPIQIRWPDPSSYAWLLQKMEKPLVFG